MFKRVLLRGLLGSTNCRLSGSGDFTAILILWVYMVYMGLYGTWVERGGEDPSIHGALASYIRASCMQLRHFAVVSSYSPSLRSAYGISLPK